MIMTYKRILQEYFSVSAPYRTDGTLTTTGSMAVNKLHRLLADLEALDIVKVDRNILHDYETFYK